MLDILQILKMTAKMSLFNKKKNQQSTK